MLPPLAASVVEDKSELAPVIGECKAFSKEYERSLTDAFHCSRHSRYPELNISPL